MIVHIYVASAFPNSLQIPFPCNFTTQCLGWQNTEKSTILQLAYICQHVIGTTSVTKTFSTVQSHVNMCQQVVKYL